MRLQLLSSVAVVSLALTSVPATAQEKYHDPGPALVRILDAAPIPRVVVSPDRQRLLIMDRAALPPIAQVAAPGLRLAGVRLDPASNAPSHAELFTSLVVQPIQGEVRRIVIPWQSRVGHVMWAPDSRTVAFTLVEETGLSLWTAEASTGDIRLLLGPVLNGAFGNPCSWLPSGSGLLCSTIPADRSAPPAGSDVPVGPIVRDSRGAAPSSAPDQDLLQNPGDEALFEHYFTDQLVVVPLSGPVRPIGAPGMHASAAVSPDGKFLLVQSLHKPFSYSVPWQRFGARTEVWNLNGQLIQQIADRGLRENSAESGDSVPAGPREIHWRPDRPASLVWVEALDGGNPAASAPFRDRVAMLDAPFSGAPAAIADFGYRATEVIWSRSDLAVVTERWERPRRIRTWAFDPSNPSAARHLLFDRAGEDPALDPGRFLLIPAPGGDSLLLTSKDGRFAFLSGSGASPDGDRPFLDRVELASGRPLRLFRSEGASFEEPVAMLDPDAGRFLSRREGLGEPPNYFIRDLRKASAAQLSQVTRFKDPAPEFSGILKQRVPLPGAEGSDRVATVWLPPGYDRSKGPLPFLVWVVDQAPGGGPQPARVPGSPFRFDRPSGASPLFLLLEGYGVLEWPTGPGAGNPDELLAGARAAVEKVVGMGIADAGRLAVGGYSNGGRVAAQLVGRSNLFKAGIALEPPSTVTDSVRGPLLLVHGVGDAGSRSAPQQTERSYAAMTGLGDTVRLVLLQGEQGSYRARESVGQVLYEMVRWLDLYVKPGAK